MLTLLDISPRGALSVRPLLGVPMYVVSELGGGSGSNASVIILTAPAAGGDGGLPPPDCPPLVYSVGFITVNDRFCVACLASIVTNAC